MKSDDKHSSAGPTIAAALIALAATITTVIFSYTAGKEKAESEAAMAFSFPKEHFNLRVEEYSKLARMLVPISSHADSPLTPATAHQISRDLNQWFYDRGGIVAQEVTRRLVYKLIKACAAWKEGPQPEEIHLIKNWIMYSCRNDLDIVSEGEVEISIDALRERTKKRNEAIKERHEKASLFKE